MTAPGALTEQDVAGLRAKATGGTPVTVWFTAAAVGVPAGGSAKVVAVGDPPEGDFIQVRPAGTRDTMFCAPNELTRSRPARGRAATAPPAAKPPAAKRPTRKPSAPSPGDASAPAAAPAPPVPTAAPRRRADRSGEVGVSLRATADGEWTAEVLVGGKRVVGPVAVQAADVVAAARSLPPTVAEAVESSLDAARRRQRDRVEQLRAELDAAQRVLDELGA